MSSEARVVALEFGSVDLTTRWLRRPDGDSRRLTPTEGKLLKYLVDHAPAAVSRSELLREVWGYSDGVRTRTVDTTMRRLRRKLERVPGVPRHLETVEGVGYRFVAAASLDGGASAVAVDALIGRADELALMDRLLAESSGSRLVCVVGPGGVGKTRLVREWLRSRKGIEAPLGDLAEGACRGTVLEAVASAAGVRATTVAELAVRLELRGVWVVLLDNAEHVVDGVAPVARELAAAGLRVVVTSRVVLGVPGEARVEVSPLGVDDGVALLRRRSPSVLGDAEDDVLKGIVKGVDGLPLALEMAAARGAVLGAQGLRERLAGGAWDVLDSSVSGRSLTEVARWSWSLLPESGRVALRSLAAFRGGFTVEAAEAVVGGGGALDALQVLRDQSWLRTRGDGGWRLDLLVPLREFVVSTVGVDPGALDRHATWFARSGEEAARDALERDNGVLRATLAADWQNLLSAIDHALLMGQAEVAAGALVAAWEAAKLGRSGVELVKRGPMVQAALTTASPWWPRVGVLMADLRRNDSDVAEAVALAMAARDVALANGDVQWAARGAAMAAVLYQEHCDYDAALAHHEVALAETRAHSLRRIEAVVLSNSGNLMLSTGRLEEAQHRLERAVAICESEGFVRRGAVVLSNLGVVFHDRGQLERAEACYLRALEVHEAHRNVRYIGLVCGNLGELALDRGDVAQAVEYLDDAVAVHAEVGAARLEAVVWLSKSEAARMLGDLPAARRFAEAAAAAARRAGARVFEVSAEACLAELETEPAPERSLARLVGAVAELSTLSATTAELIARCRLERLWRLHPTVSAAGIGWSGGREAVLAPVVSFVRSAGIAQRSELGRQVGDLVPWPAGVAG